MKKITELFFTNSLVFWSQIYELINTEFIIYYNFFIVNTTRPVESCTPQMSDLISVFVAALM